MKKTKKRVAKEQFNLVAEYKKCWRYLRESRKFVHIAIGIFLLFFLVGFFIPAPQIVVDKILEFIKELIEETSGMSKLELIKFIISNNAKSTFFGMFFGMFLGFFPIVSAIINGYLVGFVSMLSVNSSGLTSLWKLIPHGIFEMPAVFISLGLGIRFGTFIFQKDKKKMFKYYLTNSFRIFLLIIIPLLVIAGIIEGILIAVGN